MDEVMRAHSAWLFLPAAACLPTCLAISDLFLLQIISQKNFVFFILLPTIWQLSILLHTAFSGQNLTIFQRLKLELSSNSERGLYISKRRSCELETGGECRRTGCHTPAPVVRQSRAGRALARAVT